MAAQHTKEHLDQWQTIALAIAALNAKTSEVGLIAQQLVQLLSLPIVLSHIHLVCAYDDSFFQPHFNYLKKVDSRSKIHGFNVRNMPLHCYIMHQDLVHISEHWNDMAEFRTFVSVFGRIPSPPYSMQDLVSKFINLALD